MVMITGNAEGLKAASAEAETSVGGLASKLGGIGNIAALGIGAAGVAIAAFSMKAAADVGGAYKTIEQKTGVVTTANTAMGASFRDVFSHVPEDAQTVASAMSDIYDKSQTLNNGVKLTGQGLDDLTEKFLEWSHISGASVTSLIDTTTAWAGAWHMSSSQVSEGMDEVEKAAQSTGEDVGTLTSDLQRMAPAATQLGLSFKETTADVSGFEEAGLKATSINSAMNKTFTDGSKAGEDVHARWEENITTLGKYETAIQSGNKAQAEAITKTTEWAQVTKDFSARTLTQLITAVGEGKMSISDMNAMLENSSGAIQKTYTDTETFSMKLDTFKNSLETAFAPLGSSLINILTSVLAAITPLIPIITALVNVFTMLPGPIQTVIVLGVGLVGGMSALNLVLNKVGAEGLANFVPTITTMIAKIRELGTTSTATAAEMAPLKEEEAMGGGAGFVQPGAMSAKGMESAAPGALEAGAGAEAGAGSEGILAGITAAMAGLIGEGGALEGIFTAVTGTLGTMIAPIMATVTGITEAVTGGGTFLEIIMGVASAFNPVTIAIAAVLAVFVVLYATSQTFRNSIGSIIDQFMSLVGWVGTLAGDILSLNFSKFGGDLISGITGGFNTVKNDIMGFPGMILTSFQEAGASIMSFFGGIGDKIKGAFSGAFDFLKNIDFGGVANQIQGGLTGAFNTAKGAVDTLHGAINTVTGFDYGGAANNVKNQVGGAFDSAKSAVMGFGTTAENAGISVVNALGPKVQTAIAATGAVSKTLQSTLTQLEPIAEKAGTGMKSAFDSFSKGDIGGGISKLKDTFTDVFNSISKMDWKTIGTKIISEIIETVKAKAGEIMGAISGALGGAGAAVGGIGNSILNSIKGALGQVGALLLQAFNTLKSIDWMGILTTFLIMLKANLLLAFQYLKTIDWMAIFTTFLTMLKTILLTAFDALKSINWGGIIGGLLSSIAGIGSSILSSITGALGQLGGLLMGAFDALHNIDWGGIFAGMLDAISGVLDTIMNFDPGPLIDTITNAIGSAFDTIMNIDWGGLLGGLIDSITNMITGIDWGGMVNGLINAITGAFSSLFGGGGAADATKATTGGGSADIGTHMSKSVEKAGPDILGKLVGVFEKLVMLLPTVFIKIGAALLGALEKVDWGSVGGKLMNAITTALKDIGNFLGKINWGAVGTAVWTAIVTALTKIITWLESLDWGGFVLYVWNALIALLGTIIAWLESLDWGGYATTVWNALVNAIGGIVDWLKGLPWADWAHELWDKIVAALTGFGQWLLTNAETFFGGLPDKIKSAISGFGDWLKTNAESFFSGLPDKIKGALTGFGDWILSAAASAWDATTGIGGKIAGALSAAAGAIGDAMLSGIKSLWNAGPLGTVAHWAAQGAVVSASPGGVPVMVAEAGESEAIIPQKMWWGVNPAILNALPKFGGGGVIGNVSTVARTEPSSSGSGGTTKENTYYNVYVSVDSESITNKVFTAIRELENYHHL